jgi:hypothetical protein
MITARTRHGSILAIALALSGCEAAPPETETITQALTVGLPAGLTCGIGYIAPFQTAAFGSCNGFPTAQFTGTSTNYTIHREAGPGFLNVQAGDRGLGPNFGFYNQTRSFTDAAAIGKSDDLALPRGTACGFKETCNDTGEMCFGNFDPARNQCPTGWVPRRAMDILGASNCNFAWCEYLDPHRHSWKVLASGAEAPGGDCPDDPMPPDGTNHTCLPNLPSGTACGITDKQSPFNTGVCVTTFTPSGSCPAGFTAHPFFDWGRPAGVGVTWCSKN